MSRKHKLRKLEMATCEFGMWCLTELRGNLGCDLDGAAAQDEACRLGLLAYVTVTEPCGENCVCAEYDDFPQECLRTVIQLID